ncbi:Rad4 beta-hairpin domain 3-domain-containing protein [Chytriomyces sp. MP71]|nr:Rad4 beta-hairpin domain 3-domain-containing protein [Chytriomyces sp. MP71]
MLGEMGSDNDSHGKRKAESDSDSFSDEEVWVEIAPTGGDVDLHAGLEGTSGEVGGLADGDPIEVDVVIGTETKRRPAKVKVTGRERRLRKALHQTHAALLLRALVVRNERACDEVVQGVVASLLVNEVGAIGPLVAEWCSLFGVASEEGLKLEENKENPDLEYAQPDATASEQDLLNDLIAICAHSHARAILLQHPNKAAILFAALARACKLDARLVASIHPTPLSFAYTALSPCYRPHKPVTGDDPTSSIDFDQLSEPKQDDPGNESDAHDSEDDDTPSKSMKREKVQKPPAKKRKSVPPATPCEHDALRLWVQLYDSGSKQWLNVDPHELLLDPPKPPPANMKAVMDPSTYVREPTSFEKPHSAPDQQQLAYVFVCNADGAIKDVSQMFNTRWGARVAKLRPHDDKTQDAELWQRIIWLLSGERGEPGNGEVDEDMKLKKAPEQEVMPTRFDGFKNNPIYALERHCTQNEIILPVGKTYSIGTFRNELVYPRSSVHELQNAINWRKRGRQVKPGEGPLKKVKARASTTARKREMEADRINNDGAGGAEETGLFALWQTEEVVPEALVAGKIPRNRFGNFELLHENMMPEWGARVLVPGAAAVARKLKLDFVNVMTGFEHHRGRATPVIQGIMVLKENKELLVEAIFEDNRNAEAKAEKERTKRALKNWKKLIEKAVVRAELNEKYL